MSFFDPRVSEATTVEELADTARLVWFLEDPAFEEQWAQQHMTRSARRKLAKQIWQRQRTNRKRIKRIAQELHDRHKDDADRFFEYIYGRLPEGMTP